VQLLYYNRRNPAWAVRNHLPEKTAGILAEICWGAPLMRDVYQLLRQKELDLERVRKEISALRAVVPMLAEGNDSVVDPFDLSRSPAPQKNKWPLKVGDLPPAPLVS
jgi:hypothetical protein